MSSKLAKLYAEHRATIIDFVIKSADLKAAHKTKIKELGFVNTWTKTNYTTKLNELKAVCANELKKLDIVIKQELVMVEPDLDDLPELIIDWNDELSELGTIREDRAYEYQD
jgi:hypothetical protein